MIDVVGLSKEIHGAPVLRGVTIELAAGKIYGLVGPNGSGKTMLLRALCGLIHSTAGGVWLDGRLLGRDLAFPPSVGVMIENPEFLSARTGFANLELLASIRRVANADAVRAALRGFGLDPDDPRPFGKYSLGMRQRLGLACAFMEKPELLLLDEPTNALDEQGIAACRCAIETAKDDGACCVIACHDRTFLDSVADELFSLAEGRVVRHEELG